MLTTMTVWDRRIRQKHNFASSSSPIQYLPLLSSQPLEETAWIGTLTDILLTTLPTATSNLFLGLATYGFRTGGLGTGGRGVLLKEILAALEYPEMDLALVALLEASEKVGEEGRKALGVLNGERARLNEGFVGVTGLSATDTTLALRWREE
jgi:hypothetical protein